VGTKNVPTLHGYTGAQFDFTSGHYPGVMVGFGNMQVSGPLCQVILLRLFQVAFLNVVKDAFLTARNSQ
jgi:hypothetical protein